MTSTSLPLDQSLDQSPADYITLLKPKVMTLVVFAGFVGLYLTPEFHAMHGAVMAAAMLSLAIGAGAAGAINMWYDRDIDAVMTRTQNRPVPSGRISADAALGFGVIMAGLSVLTMMICTNLLAASLLAFSIFFYAVIYTMGLKRSTPQNIVIGGAAGAFPPVIMAAAASGEVTAVSLALFALIFFWTPPHFWALALLIKDEYARAGVPMMPVANGVASTKRQMLIYTLVLLTVSLAPTLLGVTGWIYGAAALVLSGLFIISAVRVMRSDDTRPARAMFGYSIVYLFALLALMIIDKV
jgi:protoheme IX farnesyltransferase